MIDYFKSLTIRERLILLYFAVSFILIFGVADTTPILVSVAIVANFGNAARLIRRIPTPQTD